MPSLRFICRDLAAAFGNTGVHLGLKGTRARANRDLIAALGGRTGRVPIVLDADVFFHRPKSPQVAFSFASARCALMCYLSAR